MSNVEAAPGAILYMQTNPDEAVIQMFGDYYYIERQKKPVGLGRTIEKAKNKLTQLKKNHILEQINW